LRHSLHSTLQKNRIIRPAASPADYRHFRRFFKTALLVATTRKAMAFFVSHPVFLSSSRLWAGFASIPAQKFFIFFGSVIVVRNAG
jgi:hypothetical protein